MIQSRGGLVQMLYGRIVGGTQTTIQAYPYQVSMHYYGSHRCGGSVITATKILTAAHCTYRLSAGSLSVRAGTTYPESSGQLIAVSKINQHTGYNDNSLVNDIAVLILRSALSLSNSVRAISIPNQGATVNVGANGQVTGWGAQREGGGIASALRVVSVPVVSNQQCSSLYGGGITNNMLCAGFLAGGKDSCQGDSGGPYVINGVQHGVVSFGYGCARPNYPGVYTRVANYRTWINNAN